jgi:hypothetical protein
MNDKPIIIIIKPQPKGDKRISYLKGYKIIKLSEYAKNENESLNTLLNMARRKTIPAFREKGVWKIGV